MGDFMGTSKLIQFKIVGIFPAEEFQKCKYYADYLYKQLPNVFAHPKYGFMLDVQWTDYLTKARRNLGTRLWKLDVPVMVFKDGEYFGDDKEFTRYCNVRYRYHAFENFDLIGKERLFNFVRNSERTHVYFIISIDDEVIGALLFQLYSDLVPLTCSNFMRLVQAPKRGFKTAPIHRIVKNAWIQIGGYNLKHNNKIPCENYYVSHDERGVLSMCHNGKHNDNSTQFFISLQKSNWMDYYYVAFGQLIHGEEILQKIEAVQTYHESPIVQIVIEECGEYSFDKPVDKKFEKEFKHYIGVDDEERREFKNYPDDISDFRDIDSFYSEKRFQQGFYSLEKPSDSIVGEA